MFKKEMQFDIEIMEKVQNGYFKLNFQGVKKFFFKLVLRCQYIKSMIINLV